MHRLENPADARIMQGADPAGIDPFGFGKARSDALDEHQVHEVRRQRPRAGPRIRDLADKLFDQPSEIAGKRASRRNMNHRRQDIGEQSSRGFVNRHLATKHEEIILGAEAGDIALLIGERDAGRGGFE